MKEFILKCKNIISTNKFKKIYNICTYIIFSCLSFFILSYLIFNISNLFKEKISFNLLGKLLLSMPNLLLTILFIILTILLFVKKKVNKGLISFNYAAIITIILNIIDNRFHLTYHKELILMENKLSIYIYDYAIILIICLLILLIILFIYCKLNKKEETITYVINKQGNKLINLFNILLLIPFVIVIIVSLATVMKVYDTYISDRYVTTKYMTYFKEILFDYIIPKTIGIAAFLCVIVRLILNIRKQQQPFLLAPTMLLFIGCRIITIIRIFTLNIFGPDYTFNHFYLVFVILSIVEIIIEGIFYLGYIAMFIIWYRFNSFQRKRILRKGDAYETI